MHVILGKITYQYDLAIKELTAYIAFPIQVYHIRSKILHGRRISHWIRRIGFLCLTDIIIYRIAEIRNKGTYAKLSVWSISPPSFPDLSSVKLFPHLQSEIRIALGKNQIVLHERIPHLSRGIGRFCCLVPDHFRHFRQVGTSHKYIPHWSYRRIQFFIVSGLEAFEAHIAQYILIRIPFLQHLQEIKELGPVCYRCSASYYACISLGHARNEHLVICNIHRHYSRRIKIMVHVQIRMLGQLGYPVVTIAISIWTVPIAVGPHQQNQRQS